MASEGYFLGVDLGGTQMRMGAVSPDGRLVGDVLSSPTGREFGVETLRGGLTELTDRMRATLNGHDIQALGLGIAGAVGPSAVSQLTNLPLLTGIDLEALLREAAPCPVALENDARCFALAEARYGAGRGARNVCGITLGTGVGCGVILDGRPHRGAGRQAGEVWNVPLRGRHLEHFLAGSGVVRGYEAAGGELTAGIDAAEIATRARAGDAAAHEAWRLFAEDLALLCGFAIGLVDPELIVIGGSLAAASDLWRPVLAARLAEHKTPIVMSQLGAAAGVIGAAALNITGGY